MKVSYLSTLCMSLAALTQARYVMYLDHNHPGPLPNNTVTGGIDTVILSYVNSTHLNSLTPGNYTPFIPISTLKPLFSPNTSFVMGTGEWGDVAGFSAAARTEESRNLFAKNIKAALDEWGFDGVDVDWEYPGGNGPDYLVTPNSAKTNEVNNFPLLLSAIRSAIGDSKSISIAVPGRVGDMIAYTQTTAPGIWKTVDFVNIMTYDLTNRRDGTTGHAASVVDALATIDYYLNTLGLPAQKAQLGLPFYAKFYPVDQPCSHPNGLKCTMGKMENADGSDNHASGVLTFEAAYYVPAPSMATMQTATDAKCGGATLKKCPSGSCCSMDGWCGNLTEHCGPACLPEYSDSCVSKGPSLVVQFQNAMKNGILDSDQGAMSYYDKDNAKFWTWDNEEVVRMKIEQIVQKRGLGGVSAWSLGEDTATWEHVIEAGKGMMALKGGC